MRKNMTKNEMRDIIMKKAYSKVTNNIPSDEIEDLSTVEEKEDVKVEEIVLTEEQKEQREEFRLSEDLEGLFDKVYDKIEEYNISLDKEKKDELKSSKDILESFLDKEIAD